jgi:hypothetical protein
MDLLGMNLARSGRDEIAGNGERKDYRPAATARQSKNLISDIKEIYAFRRRASAASPGDSMCIEIWLRRRSRRPCTIGEDGRVGATKPEEENKE